MAFGSTAAWVYLPVPLEPPRPPNWTADRSGISARTCPDIPPAQPPPIGMGNASRMMDRVALPVERACSSSVGKGPRMLSRAGRGPQADGVNGCKDSDGVREGERYECWVGQNGCAERPGAVLQLALCHWQPHAGRGRFLSRESGNRDIRTGGGGVARRWGRAVVTHARLQAGVTTAHRHVPPAQGCPKAGKGTNPLRHIHKIECSRSPFNRHRLLTFCVLHGFSVMSDGHSGAGRVGHVAPSPRSTRSAMPLIGRRRNTTAAVEWGQAPVD